LFFSEMGRSKEQLAIVENWRRKGLELSNLSNDALLSLAAKGFEIIEIVLSNKSDNIVLHSLASLESERKLALEAESEECRLLSLPFGDTRASMPDPSSRCDPAHPPLRSAITRMRRNGAGGPDKINGSILRNGRPVLHSLLASRFSHYLTIQENPKQWKASNSILINKKG
ncbi:hypothetical protein PMAYCL1PPCAC_20386, partial [Pristionchus mayeri]